MNLVKCLYVKQNGETSIIPFEDNLLNNKEHLAISPTHDLFYDLDKPLNKLFSKYGCEVYGDVVIIKSGDDEDSTISIENNIVDLLEDILKKDKEQRKNFINEFKGNIIII